MREYFVEARYVGQQFEVEIPLPVRRFAAAEDVRRLVEVFNDFHERLYAVHDPGSEIECINWKGRLTAGLDKPRLQRADEQQRGEAKAQERQQHHVGADDRERDRHDPVISRRCIRRDTRGCRATLHEVLQYQQRARSRQRKSQANGLSQKLAAADAPRGELLYQTVQCCHWVPPPSCD